MSTYTPSLGLEEITPGDQAGLWGNTTNNNLALIDQAVTGVTPLSFTGASGTTVTLTDFNGATDEARSAVLNITGIATGSNNVVVPNKQKTYLVRNNTGQDVVFKTATPGDTYTVGSGYSILIFCDGNNNVYTGIQSPSVGTLPVSAGGTGVATFTAGFVKSAGGTTNLTSSSSINLSSEVSNVLPVANGGTGQTSLTSGAVLVGNGTGSVGVVVPGTTDYVLTSNGPGSTPSFRAPSSASYPGAGIAVSTGSAWTTSYSSGNPIPVSLGGIGATSLSAAGIASLTTSSQQTFTGSLRCPAGIDTGVSGMGLFGKAINFDTYSSIYYSANQMQFAVSTSSFNLCMLLDAGGVYMGKSVYPNSDNAYALGWSGGRWTVVYAVNGAIQTSDRTEKTEIADLDEVEKRVAIRIKGLIKKFKWKDSIAEKGLDGARIHVGVIAQDVGDAFRAEGLDPHKYGMFCYDEWEAKDKVLGKDGEVASPAVSAGSRYGVRYDQLLAFVIAAL